MPKIIAHGTTSVTSTNIEHEEPLTQPSTPEQEDRFEHSRPDWWGFCDSPNISFWKAATEAYAQAQVGLNSAGIVTISEYGVQVLPTIEQLDKIKELISKSDKALYFLVETDGDKIRSIEAFGKKKDWLNNLPITMPNLSHVSIDKVSQTNCINKLCKPDFEG